MSIRLRTTKCHLPYGITPDAGEHVQP